MRRLAVAAVLLACAMGCVAAWRAPGGHAPARRLAQTADIWATGPDPWGCAFSEGDVVYCNKTGHPRYQQVARIENATLHLYPSRESWENDGSPPPTESSAEACDKLDSCPEGDPMPEGDPPPLQEQDAAQQGYTAQPTAPQLPSPQPVQSCPMTDGAVVACLDGTAGGIGIGRVEGGRVRWYPTDQAYEADGSPATGYSSSTTSCSMARQCGDGPPMPAPVCPFVDGDVVRCTTTGAIAKMVGGRLHGYPNPASYAADGSPAWTYNSAAVCEQAKLCPEGEPMPQGAPVVTPVPTVAASPPPSDSSGGGGGSGNAIVDGITWAAGALWNWLTG